MARLVGLESFLGGPIEGKVISLIDYVKKNSSGSSTNQHPKQAAIVTSPDHHHDRSGPSALITDDQTSFLAPEQLAGHPLIGPEANTPPATPTRPRPAPATWRRRTQLAPWPMGRRKLKEGSTA
ncbi:predicted protein [Histoplasma mississippiense (nom. inval.)]|uniref:predicted protein n=1 Tax=Ajellomyces capsulatus (strain NAm1 / WU24) TaxID=2059318 RepID=UPI000157CD82|nr:predicted protein [Histoplasma mississippiense (nom. inval.)]EDN10153.1 predicted protein [Histoplasma mississippiense (nom. inval.)]